MNYILGVADTGITSELLLSSIFFLFKEFRDKIGDCFRAFLRVHKLTSVHDPAKPREPVLKYGCPYNDDEKGNTGKDVYTCSFTDVDLLCVYLCCVVFRLLLYLPQPTAS